MDPQKHAVEAQCGYRLPGMHPVYGGGLPVGRAFLFRVCRFSGPCPAKEGHAQFCSPDLARPIHEASTAAARGPGLSPELRYFHAFHESG